MLKCTLAVVPGGVCGEDRQRAKGCLGCDGGSYGFDHGHADALSVMPHWVIRFTRALSVVLPKNQQWTATWQGFSLTVAL